MKKRLLALLMISIVLLTACGTTSETQNSPGASEKDNIESGASSSASDDKKNSGVDHTVSAVSIKFDYQVMPNEASNQVAAWVENEKGKLVKTIYVSDFTGSAVDTKCAKMRFPIGYPQQIRIPCPINRSMQSVVQRCRMENKRSNGI